MIELPSDEIAKQLVSRSVSIRCIAEHWSDAPTLDEFHQQLKDFAAANFGKPHFDNNVLKSSFRVTVESFNKRITLKDKVEKIESVSYLPFQGDIDLNNPDNECFYIEYYTPKDQQPVLADPDHIFFGKWVSRAAIFGIQSKRR